MKMTPWRKIWKFFTNKFVLTIVVFLVVLFFVSSNNIFSQYRLRKNLHELKREKQFYEREIARNKAALDKLLNDKEHLEKFAREKYFMKRDNEDIFVFVEE